MATPFSIKLFLVDGKPDGIRIIEKSNWSGIGIAFPRLSTSMACKRQEAERAGVYVLIGPSNSGESLRIYVGHADPVGVRLNQHNAGPKDFWTWAIFFASKDGTLNKADVQHLESRLIKIAASTKRADLDNQNAPTQPNLTEAEVADAESFLADVLSILPMVGLRAFQDIKNVDTPDDQRLFLNGKGAQATGFESNDQFIVERGSTAVINEVKSIHGYLTDMRSSLKDKGILEHEGNVLRFKQNHPFGSPSAAAGVILGRSANGTIEWKNRSGTTLKQLRAAQDSNGV